MLVALPPCHTYPSIFWIMEEILISHRPQVCNLVQHYAKLTVGFLYQLFVYSLPQKYL